MESKQVMKKCPHCDDMFDIRGMNSHIRFKHPDPSGAQSQLDETEYR